MPIAAPAAEISSALTRSWTPHAKDRTLSRLRLADIVRTQPTRHSSPHQHPCISAVHNTSTSQLQQGPSLFSWLDSPRQGCCQSAKPVYRICRSRHSMRSTTACPAYVGEATASAGEYHCNDFDWEEHKQEVLAQLAVQQTQISSSATANSAAVDSAKANSATATSATASLTQSADVTPAAPHVVTGKMDGSASQHASDGSMSGSSNESATSAGHGDVSITAVASGQFVHSPGVCNPPVSSPGLTELELQPRQHSAAKHEHSGGSQNSAASQQEASNGEAFCKQAAAVPVSGSERRTQRLELTDNKADAGLDISDMAVSQKQKGAVTSRAAGGIQPRHKGTTKQVASTGAVPQAQSDAEDGVKVLDTGRQWQYDSSCWESFHARDNATARFYKERRYLLLEFPCLMVHHPPQHFLEIGCGCGSSLLPVLKANPSCRVTGTDLSPTAVQMFESAARKAGIAQDRVTAFAADSTQPEAVASFSAGKGTADAVLLIFTLAALAPAQMSGMLQAAFQALKPGGQLLIRDHGLYDLTHLRLRPEQQLSERLYRRLDGTMCYFFTTEDLQARAEAAGFVTRECAYACVKLLNRKTKTQMKRVFVHGVFARPLSAPELVTDT